MKFPTRRMGSGKSFLKLKAGDAIRGVFRGEPYQFRTHWVENRGVVCTGRDKCALCKAGEKSSFRFRINFITQENGAYVAKVFEQGATVYDSMKAIHEGDYDLSSYIMKITRNGSDKETTYSLIPVPNGKLSKDQEKLVSEVALIALADDEEDGDSEGGEE